MSVRNGFVLLITLSALTFLVACGGNGNGIINPTAPPTGGFSTSNLNGSYVFSVSGLDQGGFPYVAVGSFTANGSGGISGGSVDINDTEFTSGAIAGAPLSGGSTYTIGLDGRGTATLTFQNSSNNPFTGSNSITLKFVLQDSFHGLVIEFDNTASGSGTIDQQTTGVTPTGTYAFLLSGNAFGASPTPLGLAGNFAVGSGGTLTGLEDFNEGGANVYAGATLSGTLVAGPSSTPATTISNPLTNSLQAYDVYVIDASHMKIIETDSFATLSGDAYAQTTATLPTTATTLAFTLFGDNASGVEALGGFMVTDGNGNITNSSSEDFNTNSAVSTAAGSFTGTYTAAGTGRYTFGSFTNFVGGTSYAAYPSSGGVLLLEIDTPGPVAGITAGAAYPQTAGAAFASSQGYGLNLTGVNLLGSPAVEVDDIAEFTANSGGTITGVLDENFAAGGGPSVDLAFTTSSSSFGAIDSSGRYGLSSPVANGNNSTLEGGFNLTFYAVDGSMFPFIEIDSSQPAVGMIIEQNASATTPLSVTGHGSMYVPRPMVVPHSLKEVKQK
jgi:hypothetical protein